jgi:hypothetical protein
MKNSNIILLIVLLTLSLTALYLNNNPNKQSSIVQNSSTSSINNLTFTTSSQSKNSIFEKVFPVAVSTDDGKSKYADGRKTGVRVLKYHNDLVKTGIPMQDAKQGLTTIITEWNEYDANVASPQGAFIEKPTFLTEAEKKELREADVKDSDMNSQMVGGTEEDNKVFKESSIRYWAVASKMFEQEFKNLKKAESISDRTVDYVTFDFITTSGFYTVQVPKSDLESGKSIWSKMFEESKFLNTELARVQNEAQFGGN